MIHHSCHYQTEWVPFYFTKGGNFSSAYIIAQKYLLNTITTPPLLIHFCQIIQCIPAHVKYNFNQKQFLYWGVCIVIQSGQHWHNLIKSTNTVTAIESKNIFTRIKYLQLMSQLSLHQLWRIYSWRCVITCSCTMSVPPLGCKDTKNEECNWNNKQK